MTLTTRNLTPRIATEIRNDKQTLLSGAHATQIRELLEQQRRAGLSPNRF